MRATSRKRTHSASSSGNRRDKEKQLAAELTSLLPLPAPIRDKLDKPNAVKIANAVFLLQHVMYQTDGIFSILRAESLQASTGPAYASVERKLSDYAMSSLQTMDGFLVILDFRGILVYVSETAAVHFGYSQVDLIGLPLETIVHESDIKFFQSMTTPMFDGEHGEHHVSCTLRMKCAPGRRTSGSLLGGYKTIHFTGRRLPHQECRFIGYGEPIVTFAYNEHRLSPFVFIFRATMALRMIFVESRIEALTGFTALSFLDHSLYRVIHADDLEVVRTAHHRLTESGQAQSGYYRLLRHGGGCNWVMTKFIRIACNGTTHLPLVIGINYMLSEDAGPVYDSLQTVEAIPSVNDTCLGEYSAAFMKSATHSDSRFD